MNTNGEGDKESDALICESVYVLAASGECYSCKKNTRLFALMALPPFETVGDQEEAMDENGSMLKEIAEMPQSLKAIVVAISKGKWREDYSRTVAETYWMNHCEWCDAKQGDFFVQGADGPFWPYSEEDLAAIEASRVEGPHTFASADTSYSGAMAGWRDRRHGVVRPPIKPRRKTKRR